MFPSRALVMILRMACHKFVCDQCNKNFKTLGWYTKHMQAIGFTVHLQWVWNSLTALYCCWTMCLHGGTRSRKCTMFLLMIFLQRGGGVVNDHSCCCCMSCMSFFVSFGTWTRCIGGTHYGTEASHWLRIVQRPKTFALCNQQVCSWYFGFTPRPGLFPSEVLSRPGLYL